MYLLPICKVTSWPWPFGHTWRVTWPTPPPSLKIPHLSVLELWVMMSPINNHGQCVCSHCACIIPRDLCVGDKYVLHIWNHLPQFVFQFATYMALWSKQIKLSSKIMYGPVFNGIQLPAYAPNHMTKITTYLECPTPLPIHYITFMGLWRRLRVIYSWDFHH